MNARRHERGVVLFVALIILVVMTLAGLALLRQMGAGVSIAGNVAFKENATSVADRGAEVAREYLVSPVNAALLIADDLPNGYHATWEAGVDPADFPWDTGSRTINADFASTGNTARVMIHRLCAASGPATAPGQRCSDSVNAGAGGSRGGGSYPGFLPGTAPFPFFRITTRVDGPRSTVSYTQVVLQ